jgi:YidC/Oxa1 family membrane protein insertase
MDNELSRLILALILTGVVFFAWSYYRGVLSDKASESIVSVKQIEKVEVQKENIRKDLSIYKNCGTLKIVVHPIYRALEFINNKVKNPGIALIMITVAIRLLLIPMTFKQIKSSRKMAKLKDEIEAIKNQYKGNSLEIQKAVSRFYVKKGINPLSNFGLAALQIPLFIALYKIVDEASLFSGAALGIWINDLSAPDPYFILPLIAGIVMYLGSRYPGNRETQSQQWLLYLPPVLFTIFLLKQPSGLALYMLVGGIFQFIVNVASGWLFSMREKSM